MLGCGRSFVLRPAILENCALAIDVVRYLSGSFFLRGGCCSRSDALQQKDLAPYSVIIHRVTKFHRTVEQLLIRPPHPIGLRRNKPTQAPDILINVDPNASPPLQES